MKIRIENLGVLREAEFTLGDLTLICGKNNTGKTYATYALYGFLKNWNDFSDLDVSDQDVDTLFREESVRVPMNDLVRQAPDFLRRCCTAYVTNLHVVFGAPAGRFRQANFEMTLSEAELHSIQVRKIEIPVIDDIKFDISITPADSHLTAKISNPDRGYMLPKDIVRWLRSLLVPEGILAHLIPRAFVVSAERTGVSMFRGEIFMRRSKKLEEIRTHASDERFVRESLRDLDWTYALPVKDNLDFAGRLENLAKRESFVLQKHPEILRDFRNILGGEYRIGAEGGPSFVPEGGGASLPLDESSSGVRSLLMLGTYLRHVALPGDLLIVDEPELNLHPENQRLIARLFARLIRVGIKVLVTTHSDYIVKELNTLIMLNAETPRLKELASREGYKPEEMLAPERVKVYVAEPIPGITVGPRMTLTPADIDPRYGIEAKTFDESIREMNRIQEEIVWGGDPQ